MELCPPSNLMRGLVDHFALWDLTIELMLACCRSLTFWSLGQV